MCVNVKSGWCSPENILPKSYTIQYTTETVDANSRILTHVQ